MKKKNKSKLHKIPRFLTTVAVLAVFLFPALVTLKWADGVIFGNDPRKIQKAGEFNARPADQVSYEVVPFEEPIISISFDDGWESIYSAGFPVMQKYGIISTQYLLSEEFDNVAYMSVDQVKALLEAGHEVASHTRTHQNLTTLDDSQLYDEVAGSKNILKDKFPITNDFASPLGAIDEWTTTVIKDHYRSSRNTAADLKTIGDEDVNIKGKFDPYNINAFTIRSTTTTDELRNFINYAKSKNAWIVITYHQIDHSGGIYSVTPEVFSEHMKLIYESDIRSVPVGKVMDKIQRGDN